MAVVLVVVGVVEVALLSAVVCAVRVVVPLCGVVPRRRRSCRLFVLEVSREVVEFT